MNELALLFLLLPVAALSGWVLGRHRSDRTSGARVNELSSNYFRGLNYLLNEQQDKAIEVFLKLAEVNRDTVETHLALGNLFRRRGEVDRAIRVHQHLISRPNLSAADKTSALLELGEDYMRAGLLDRAENLFVDLVAMDSLATPALRHLVAIYQHERDWENAIAHARLLEVASGDSQDVVIAHLYCELAEQARSSGDWRKALDVLEQAWKAEPGCIRASIIRGHIQLAQGELEHAITDFEHVSISNSDYVPEVLPALLDCYRRSNQTIRAERFLTQLTERENSVSALLALAGIHADRRGDDAAIQLLEGVLRQRATVKGLLAFVELKAAQADGATRSSFQLLHELIANLLENQALYRCNRCGFGAKAHHWHCPSCKNWDTIKPIRGTIGE